MHCREHIHRVKAHADANGRILGIEVEIFVDAGAYAHWPNSPYMETGMAAKNIPGPYAIANYRAVTHTVATSKAPQGPYRGVARPAACFTIERTIDRGRARPRPRAARGAHRQHGRTRGDALPHGHRPAARCGRLPARPSRWRRP